MNDEVMECDICYSLILRAHSDQHAYWHKVAASPMAHGMYLDAKMWEALAEGTRGDGA